MGVCGSTSAGSKKIGEIGAKGIEAESTGGHNYPTAPTSQYSEGEFQKQDYQQLQKAKQDAEDLLKACQERLEAATVMLHAREGEVEILQQMVNRPNQIPMPKELNSDDLQVQIGNPGPTDDRVIAIQHGFPAILQKTIDSQKALQTEMHKYRLNKLQDRHSRQLEVVLAQFDSQAQEGQSTSLKSILKKTVTDVKAKIEQQHQAEIQQFEADFAKKLRAAESTALSMVLGISTNALGIK